MNFEQFCLQFGVEPPEYKKIGKRYFSDPNNLEDFAKKLDAYSYGIFLGEDKNHFKPTPALIRILAEKAKKSVTVNDKASWMFVCKKDVLMEGVEKHNCEKKDVVIVEDLKGNALGYGIVTNDYNPKAKNKQFVKNKLDLGDYLRRER